MPGDGDDGGHGKRDEVSDLSFEDKICGRPCSPKSLSNL